MDKLTKQLYWNIGHHVRTLRTQRHYTVEELAERAEVSVQYLYKIEAGRASFSTVIFWKLCNALNVEPNILLGENNMDLEHSVLYELVGKFTEEEKEYIKTILLNYFKELM